MGHKEQKKKQLYSLLIYNQKENKRIADASVYEFAKSYKSIKARACMWNVRAPQRPNERAQVRANVL